MFFFFLSHEHVQRNHPPNPFFLYNFTKFLSRTAAVLNSFLFYSPFVSPKAESPKSHTLNPEFPFTFSVIPPPTPSPHCTNFQAQVHFCQQKHWAVSGVKKKKKKKNLIEFSLTFLGNLGGKKIQQQKGDWPGGTYCKRCFFFLLLSSNELSDLGWNKFLLENGWVSLGLSGCE